LGTAVNAFSVLGNGNVDATITAIGPTSTVSMGFGLGQPVGSDCLDYLFTSVRDAQLGRDLSATVPAGNYCVVIADIGNLTAPANYTITVIHP
jgi:hypothetical protein